MRDADFVKIAKALADPMRHRIFEKVRAAGELTCSDICDGCPRSQPTISHHVKTLEAAGLISTRRDGLFRVLTINEPAVRAFVERLASASAPRARRAARRARVAPPR